MKDQIKFAKIEDIPQIVSFAYSTFKEADLNATGLFPNNERVTLSIANCVNEHIALVKRDDEDERKIDGVLIAQITHLWWSNEPCLLGALFYIKPSKRSFNLAKGFLDAFKEYAIIEGIPCGLDLFVKRDTEKKRKLLTYCGFDEVGSYFVFRPE